MELIVPPSTLFAVCGADASGKTEIIRLSQKYIAGLDWLPSYTTRAPREGETFENTGYVFYDDESFNIMRSNNAFVWEPVGHAGSRYGTRRNDVKRALHGPRPFITAFTMETVRRLKEWVHAYRLAVSETGTSEHLRVTALYLTVEESIRCERMLARGDAPEKVTEKLRTSQDWDAQARELRTSEGERVFDHFIDNSGSIVVPVAALCGIIMLATREWKASER